LKNIIGVQLQTSGLPANMTVNEAMKFFCAYHSVAPRYDLLDRLELNAKRSSQYHELSTGQQRRLALALAVAHKPPVVILDEPTAGLDVGSRTNLHELMQELKEEGVTIILATHDMAEAEKMTDRVAILLGGKIVATGTPRELTAAGSGLTKVSVRTEQSLLHRNGFVFPAVSQRNIKEEYAIYYSIDPGPTVSAILEYVNMKGDKLIDLRVERPSLEERFLEITHNGGAQ
jgi:ABC-2 type transport system ATP-binding protein